MTAADWDNGIFDLDAAAKAAQAEAESAPAFQFLYKGELYEFPPMKMWPIDAQADLGNLRFDSFVTKLLGRAKWEQLAATGIRQYEFEALFEGLAAATGAGSPGNSPPPRGPGSTRT